MHRDSFLPNSVQRRVNTSYIHDSRDLEHYLRKHGGWDGLAANERAALWITGQRLSLYAEELRLGGYTLRAQDADRAACDILRNIGPVMEEAA